MMSRAAPGKLSAVDTGRYRKQSSMPGPDVLEHFMKSSRATGCDTGLLGTRQGMEGKCVCHQIEGSRWTSKQDQERRRQAG